MKQQTNITGKAIGIIGCGNMGSSLLEHTRDTYKISVFDKDKEKTKHLIGVCVADSILTIVKKADLIIIAVKPQDIIAVLDRIKAYAKGKLFISIAAGISTRYIQEHLGEVAVVRVMPNLAVKIAKGMICLCKGSFTTEDELSFVKELFACTGETMIVEEDFMDAVTAISGSGPGFLYRLLDDVPQPQWDSFANNVFMQKLAYCAESLGFNSEQAYSLAYTTVIGSIALLHSSSLTVQELCNQVTSKGGTTEAGLKALNNINSLPEAVAAALSRAKELAS